LHSAAVLKVRRHHAASRISTIEEARLHGLIITTYQTVESEWRAASMSESTLLFSINWRRIILDEGKYFLPAICMTPESDFASALYQQSPKQDFQGYLQSRGRITMGRYWNATSE
jgi:hypothetical protein